MLGSQNLKLQLHPVLRINKAKGFNCLGEEKLLHHHLLSLTTMCTGGRPLSRLLGASRGDTNGFLIMGQEVRQTKARHSERRGSKPTGYSTWSPQFDAEAWAHSLLWDLLCAGDSERAPPEERVGSRKDWIQLEAPWVRSLSSTAVSLPRELRVVLPTAGCTVWQSAPGREMTRAKGWNRWKRKKKRRHLRKKN